MSNKSNPQSRGRTTHVVSPEIVRQLYDSPLSLPGKHRWVTKDEDARTIEKLLGSIPEKSIGAPLWVATHATAPWLGVVSSEMTKRQRKALSVEVILRLSMARDEPRKGQTSEGETRIVVDIGSNAFTRSWKQRSGSHSPVEKEKGHA